MTVLVLRLAMIIRFLFTNGWSKNSKTIAILNEVKDLLRGFRSLGMIELGDIWECFILLYFPRYLRGLRA